MDGSIIATILVIAGIAIAFYFLLMNKKKRDGTDMLDEVLEKQIRDLKLKEYATPGGVHYAAQKPVSEAMQRGMEKGFAHAERVWSALGWTKNISRSFYKFLVFPATDFDMQGLPAIRIYSDQYVGTIYAKVDETGRNYYLAPERALIFEENGQTEPFRSVIVESENEDFVSNLVYYGLEHLSAFHNDRHLFSNSISPSHFHPILPQPPAMQGLMGVSGFKLRHFERGADIPPDAMVTIKR